MYWLEKRQQDFYGLLVDQQLDRLVMNQAAWSVDGGLWCRFVWWASSGLISGSTFAINFRCGTSQLSQILPMVCFRVWVLAAIFSRWKYVPSS